MQTLTVVERRPAASPADKGELCKYPGQPRQRMLDARRAYGRQIGAAFVNQA